MNQEEYVKFLGKLTPLGITLAATTLYTGMYIWNKRANNCTLATNVSWHDPNPCTHSKGPTLYRSRILKQWNRRGSHRLNCSILYCSNSITNPLANTGVLGSKAGRTCMKSNKTSAPALDYAEMLNSCRWLCNHSVHVSSTASIECSTWNYSAQCTWGAESCIEWHPINYPKEGDGNANMM